MKTHLLSVMALGIALTACNGKKQSDAGGTT